MFAPLVPRAAVRSAYLANTLPVAWYALMSNAPRESTYTSTAAWSLSALVWSPRHGYGPCLCGQQLAVVWSLSARVWSVPACVWSLQHVVWSDAARCGHAQPVYGQSLQWRVVTLRTGMVSASLCVVACSGMVASARVWSASARSWSSLRCRPAVWHSLPGSWRSHLASGHILPSAEQELPCR